MFIEHEFELDDFLGRFFATVWIKAHVVPGERMVIYYKDGSGYPGSPPSVEIVEAQVTTLSGATWDKNREELEDEYGGAIKQLDNSALEAANKLLDGWLADELFEALNNIYEQYE